MAQWNGQFTGNSHLTKVRDLEETLRHAVIVFRDASSSAESFAKGKAVRKLAAKLLTARLKLLKAQLYDAEPVIANKLKNLSNRVESLRQKEAKIRSDGINGILTEFGVRDLIAEV